MKRIKTWVTSAIALTLSTWILILYVYSQKYVQHSHATATKGIFFKTTLHLDAYKKVSSGNGLLGNFDRYSRSDRHAEVLTIYCKEYCKK